MTSFSGSEKFPRFYDLLKERRVRGGQRYHPVSAIFSNTNVSYPESYQP
jgi:hypothetical protein